MTWIAYGLALLSGVGVGLWLRGLADTWKRNKETAEWHRSENQPTVSTQSRQKTEEGGKAGTARQSQVHFRPTKGTRVEKEKS